MNGDGSLIFIGCLLTGVLCQQWRAFVPKYIEALSGSCVIIPCTFKIPPFYKELVEPTCGRWVKSRRFFDLKVIQPLILGDLSMENCTTEMNNLHVDDSDLYNFRIDCSDLEYTFQQPVRILVTDIPPRPILTPAVVEVMEGTSVSLTCSAEAPCPSLPPTLTWTPTLSNSEGNLQANQDQTKVMTSVLIFTASPLHHGQTVSCAALYKLQDGNTEVSTTSSTIRVLYPPKNTSVSVSPSGPVAESSFVTLTCSSKANPAVAHYAWYRVNGGQVTSVASGHVLRLRVSEEDVTSWFLCEASNELGALKSSLIKLDIQHPPRNTSVSVGPSGSVVDGSSATLTCSSDANPAVEDYTWYRVNGSEMIPVARTQTLTLQSISDIGLFCCEARNPYGKERSDVVLNLHNSYSGAEPCSSALPIICGLVTLLWILTILFGVYKYVRLSREVETEAGRTYATLQISNVASDYDVIQRRDNGRQIGGQIGLHDYENAENHRP